MKNTVVLSETNRELYYFIRKSRYAAILWNNYFNKMKKSDLLLSNIKNAEQIFKMCALEAFKIEKKNSDRYLNEYFIYLTRKQLESHLECKKCK